MENREVWIALEGACRRNDILVEACASIADKEGLKNSVITEMVRTHSASPGTLCVRRALELDTAGAAQTTVPWHMRDNAGVDFGISGKDMETLKAVAPVRDYGEYRVFPVFNGR